jgi:hypothetical protein
VAEAPASEEAVVAESETDTTEAPVEDAASDPAE